MLMFRITFICLFSLVVADHKPPSLQDVIDRLKVVEDRLKESEKEVYILRETTSFHEELIKKQEIRINSQDIKINNQELKINALEKEIAGQNVVIGTSRAKIISNNREIKALRRQLLSVHAINGKYAERKEHILSSSVKDNRSISGKFPRQAVGGGIAFTAFLDHDGDYGPGQTIRFNKIITNDGNGYNMHTGIFTCPEEGMYLFTFAVGERSERDGVSQVFADLIINSQNIIDAVAETRQYQEDAQGGNTVIIRLTLGDSVWVRVHNPSAGHHIEADHLRITSFTGLYLYP